MITSESSVCKLRSSQPTTKERGQRKTCHSPLQVARGRQWKPLQALGRSTLHCVLPKQRTFCTQSKHITLIVTHNTQSIQSHTLKTQYPYSHTQHTTLTVTHIANKQLTQSHTTHNPYANTQPLQSHTLQTHNPYSHTHCKHTAHTVTHIANTIPLSLIHI